jgi:pimeloyl-ACP methyl ester carboxylesterase
LQLAFLLLPLAFTGPGRLFRNWLVSRVLASERIEETEIDRLLKCSLSHGYRASRQRLKLIQQHDVREQLPLLQMPVTIVASGRDRLLPSLREAQFMSHKITHCKVVVVADGGHTCFLSPRFSLASLLRENAIL